MRLVAFTVEGYRRFVERTSVKLNGDLVAFVGPNEAGKSSLLRALSHLNDPRPFDSNERPRRTKAEPTLSWLFQLEELDREVLAAIRDVDGVERVRITKTADATTAWALEPKSPNRDRSKRAVARALLTAHRGQPEFAAADDHDEMEFNFEAYDAAAEVLGLDIENYSAERRLTLAEAALQIRVVEHETTAEGDGEPTAAEEQGRLAFEAVRHQLATGLEAVVETESQPSPRKQAIDALKPLVPALIVFGEADRELASQYELEDVAEDPPPALRHLAALASLDLVALRDEALAGAVADVATRRNTANATLLEAFHKSWNQQGIAVQVEVQGTLLHIQATTPEDSGLSDIGERSDGMRWFAALLAFAHGWTKKPILLVDEIERHLHYDAQADLIEVLSRQQFTSKVIFTTHSFGCLPYDLGTGVRVVQPVDGSRSRLENGFWKAGAGFSPLLASMGAAAMSFTPARHALIAEGPSDAILLPTLLREVCDEDHLDFQVAPGLASVAASDVADLESEAGQVAFLVDGDPAGRAILKKLTRAGARRDRMLVLGKGGEPLEVEDLVDAAIYVAAVNEEIRMWNEGAERFSTAEVGESLRTSALAAWCQSKGYDVPDKTAVAQRIVECVPERRVHAARHGQLLQDLLAEIRTVLQLR